MRGNKRLGLPDSRPSIGLTEIGNREVSARQVRHGRTTPVLPLPPTCALLLRGNRRYNTDERLGGPHPGTQGDGYKIIPRGLMAAVETLAGTVGFLGRPRRILGYSLRFCVVRHSRSTPT